MTAVALTVIITKKTKKRFIDIAAQSIQLTSYTMSRLDLCDKVFAIYPVAVVKINILITHNLFNKCGFQSVTLL